MPDDPEDAGDDVLSLLYRALAERLPNDRDRNLLRSLLDRLAEGGADAVKADVRDRLRAALREAD